jgi:hypothetical protein
MIRNFTLELFSACKWLQKWEFDKLIAYNIILPDADKGEI